MNSGISLGIFMNEDELISRIKKINTDLSSLLEFPEPVKHIELTPTEQKVYLQLSLEFQKALDTAPSFQIGAYKWNQTLPELIQRYALTPDAWERISEIGDQNEEIQAQLNEMIEKIE